MKGAGRFLRQAPVTTACIPHSLDPENSRRAMPIAPRGYVDRLDAMADTFSSDLESSYSLSINRTVISSASRLDSRGVPTCLGHGAGDWHACEPGRLWIVSRR